MGFFGPSDDAIERDRRLRDRWAEFAREGVGTAPGLTHLRYQRDSWREYRAAWDSGDYDRALPMLEGVEAEADLVRRDVEARRRAMKSSAPPLEPLERGTLETTSAALSAGAAAQRGDYAQASAGLLQGATQGIAEGASGIAAAGTEGVLAGLWAAFRERPIPVIVIAAGLAYFTLGRTGRR